MSTENGQRHDEQGITLMIDNYDSFTYNIVQYLAQLGANGQARHTQTSLPAQLCPFRTDCPSFTLYFGLAHPFYQSVSIATTRLQLSKLSLSIPPTSSSHLALALPPKLACPRTS